MPSGHSGPRLFSPGWIGSQADLEAVVRPGEDQGAQPEGQALCGDRPRRAG